MNNSTKVFEWMLEAQIRKAIVDMATQDITIDEAQDVAERVLSKILIDILRMDKQ